MHEIRIPLGLSLKIYSSLLFSLLVIASMYYALYYVGGWVLMIIGAAPLLLVLSFKLHTGGLVVTKKQLPQLFKLVEEISKTLDVDMPDEIKLHPATEISVSGIFRKNLMIGLAGLRSLSLSEFKAILAHEFGHFYGRDTIIGGVLWRIHHSLEHAARFGEKFYEAMPIIHLAIIGTVIQIFYAIYGFAFKFAFLAYSRQVEHRADYVAAQIAGANNFREGLTDYSTFSRYFAQVGYDAIVHLLQQNRVFVNVYKTIYEDYRKRDVESFKIQAASLNSTGFLSTHPSLKARLTFIKADKSAIDTKPATVIFRNLKKLEKEMTLLLTRSLYQEIRPWLARAASASQQDAQKSCRHCGAQFEDLSALFKHELEHEQK